MLKTCFILVYKIKSLWAMGRSYFLIWPTVAIFNFEIQLVFLDISFSMVLRSFYTKGYLCITI